jgi:hypothetical protein
MLPIFRTHLAGFQSVYLGEVVLVQQGLFKMVSRINEKHLLLRLIDRKRCSKYAEVAAKELVNITCSAL